MEGKEGISGPRESCWGVGVSARKGYECGRGQQEGVGRSTLWGGGR